MENIFEQAMHIRAGEKIPEMETFQFWDNVFRLSTLEKLELGFTPKNYNVNNLNVPDWILNNIPEGYIVKN